MKKKILLILIMLIVPFCKVGASSSYTVQMVANKTGNKTVGTYSSYDSALSVMNNQNSSSDNVATIYKDGVPIDSKYALFKFKPGVFYLYQNKNDSSAYTSISSYYGSDAALLGYADGRVKIMISGFIGWTDINNGVVTPISLLGASGNVIKVDGGYGIRIRKSASLSGEVITKVTSTTNFNYYETKDNDGYTWFKINYNGSDAWIAKTDNVTVLNSDASILTYYNKYSQTGNLIHHYEYYVGNGYTDYFINLGTAPSFLEPDVKYYSFDGNYFYSNITSMLDDYRNGDYKNSINYNNPYYNYYLYLSSKSTTRYTAEDFDNIIKNKGYNENTSKLFGTGIYFKEAEEKYGQNALMMFGTAMNESANGTSKIAMDKNNLFGYGASDSSPYENAYSYDSVKDSIMDYAKRTNGSYSSAKSGSYYYGSHYGNKSSGRNVKYATDPYWGEKQARNSFTNDINYGGKDYNSNTIGAVYKNLSDVWIFDKPERTSEAHIYTLKNPYSNFKVYNMSLNVVDKVTGLNGVEFYKVYTDLSSDEGPLYGYIPVEEVYVSNNQPVINASDKEIKINSNFDYLNNVTAYDKEDGDLTSKITYEGEVDTTKEGEYEVTYTTIDNNNFHVSKTVKIKVVSNNDVIINASDKEVKQYTSFDYMSSVSAKDDEEDLTDKITYEGEADTTKVGEYEVVYNVVKNNKKTSKKITVKVIKDNEPVIEANDKEIYLNSNFDPLEGVKVHDEEDGDLTSKIIYEGNVDTSKIGEYEVTYKVSDKNKQQTTKKITVNVILNQLPIIEASDKTINQNDNFNPLEGIKASDKEDGDLTSKITYEGEVDTSKIGEYKIVYSVTDSYNQTVSKTIKVSVVEKQAKKVEGISYLEYIKNVSGRLEIMGYNTIQGIDNNLNVNIEYKVLFENIETGNVIEQKAARITDKSLMTRPIYSLDGNDYTYSWYKIDIDFSNIPQGNYKMYIVSSSDNYYSKSIINNKLNKTQEGSWSGDKEVVIRNNYSYDNSPIELIVRNKKLASKTASVYYNQFDKYVKFEFNNDGKLHLRGLSYSYGSNLDSSLDVTRKIIFENMDTFDTYTKNLGSITDGDYLAILPESDNLNKTRAWYDNNIDISDIPKGNYVIYITTSSNITDIYEFTEKLNRSLDNVKANINGKKYSFKINYKRGNRIELTVK